MKTMKISLVLGIVILFSSCQFILGMFNDPDPYYPEIEIKQGATVQEIGAWLDVNIEYKESPDGAVTTQTPLETWRLRTGDCSDIVILCMYMIRWSQNKFPDFIYGYLTTKGEKYGHAWIQHEGRFLECQLSCKDVTDDPNYEMVKSISYYNLMKYGTY